MAIMNQENSKKKNKASSYQNNDDPTKDKEENNTHDTCGREETYQTTTTQGLPIYSGPFLEFILFVALPKNFKLPTTLKPYYGIGDPRVHVTMFKSMMLINWASDSFLYRTFLTFLEKATLLRFSSLLARSIHDFAELLQVFVNHFHSSWVYKKTSNSLNVIQQGP